MSNLTPTIRRAAYTDAEHCLVINRAIRRTQDDRLNNIPDTLEEIRADILSKTTWIIHVDGLIVGYIACDIQSDHCVYIAEVQIDPSFQRHGIGPAALCQVMSEFERSGVSCFELVVHPENILGISSYEKTGFRAAEYISHWHDTKQPRIKMVRWVL